LRPTGFTPIGHALALAARDLPADGPRTIVLVSDGEDTCTPPDPCEVARNLRAQGVAVKVETVGLLLEGPKARGQLQCIARATGGSYRDVSSVADLASSLVDISSRAARGVTTGSGSKGRPARPTRRC
jgi:Ca-activated chloride channel family protein